MLHAFGPAHARSKGVPVVALYSSGIASRESVVHAAPGRTSGGVRKPVQARAQRLRERLLREGGAAYSELGYAATTVAVITQRADASVGSFYQYFENKDALLYELADSRSRDLIERVQSVLPAQLPSLPLDQLREVAFAAMCEVVRVVLEIHRRDPGLHAVLTERSVADRQIAASLARTEVAIVARCEALLRAVEAPGNPRLAAGVLYAMVEGAIHRQSSGEPLAPDAEFADVLGGMLHRIIFG